jgi:hypothetical protein
MLKPTLLALIAALALAPPALAADPAFEAYLRVCVATHAEHDAVIAAAEREGIASPLPPEALTKLSQGMDRPDGRFKTSADGGAVIIILGHRNVSVTDGAFDATMCMVAVTPLDPAAEAAAVDWAGVPVVKSAEQWPLMVFTGPPGQRTAVDMHDRSTYVELAKQGKLQAVSAGHNGPLSFMIYGVLVGQ